MYQFNFDMMNYISMHINVFYTINYNSCLNMGIIIIFIIILMILTKEN